MIATHKDNEINNNNQKADSLVRQRSWDSSDDEESIRREGPYLAEMALQLKKDYDMALIRTGIINNNSNVSSNNICNSSLNGHGLESCIPIESTTNSDTFNSFVTTMPWQQQEDLYDNRTLYPFIREQRSWDSSDDEESIRREGPYLAHVSAKMQKELNTALQKAGFIPTTTGTSSGASSSDIRVDSTQNNYDIMPPGHHTTITEQQNTGSCMEESIWTSIIDDESRIPGFTERTGEDRQLLGLNRRESGYGLQQPNMSNDGFTERIDKCHPVSTMDSWAKETPTLEPLPVETRPHETYDRVNTDETMIPGFSNVVDTTSSYRVDMNNDTHRRGKRKLICKQANQSHSTYTNTSTFSTPPTSEINASQINNQADTKVNATIELSGPVQRKRMSSLPMTKSISGKSTTKTLPQPGKRKEPPSKKKNAPRSKQPNSLRIVPRETGPLNSPSKSRSVDLTKEHRPQFQSPFRLLLSAGSVVRSGSVSNNASSDLQLLSPNNVMPETPRQPVPAWSSRYAEPNDAIQLFDLYESSTSLMKRETFVIPEQATYSDAPVGLATNTYLSSKRIVNGLPEWTFTVHAGEDYILYRFKAFVQPSRIQGAGMGAFLQYVGAKRLNKRSKTFNDNIFDNIEIDIELENEPIQAQLEDHGVTVTLKGAGLDEHGRKYCSYHDLEAVVESKALLSGSALRSGRQKVRIHIEGIPSNLDRKAYFVSDESRRIGYLGIHIESDYQDRDIPFPVTDEMIIDLGRYGPFRKQDRKSYYLFNLKNFIFCYEPAEWGFDVPEQLWGRDQVIDITDETTGVPHDLARQNIPMYVNEVGHNKQLTQNVFIRDEDDRVVKYFFKNKNIMKKGDVIELLTNYGSTYENVRERKGYGWANIHGWTGGDDVFANSLQRNFRLRSDIENNIMSDLSLQEISEYLQFIQLHCWDPLVRLLNERTQEAEHSSSQMSVTQMKAFLRIKWVTHRIHQKIDCYQAEKFEKIIVYNIRNRLTAMETSANQLSRSQAWQSESQDPSLAEALSGEMIEEVCFDVQEHLPMLFDRSIYCPIGCKLITVLCEIIINKCKGGAANQNTLRLNREVFEDFLKAAREALTSIKAAINLFSSGCDDVDLLFENTATKKCYFTGAIKQAFEYVKQSDRFYLQHSTLPKALLAALIEKLAYFDCLILGGIEPQWDTFAQPVDVADAVVMVKFTGFRLPGDMDETLREIGSVPRSVTSARRLSATINETWYSLWQVFCPVHIFARTFLAESVYNVDELCRELQLPPSIAHYAIKVGIDKDINLHDHSFMKCCTPKDYHARMLGKKNGNRSPRHPGQRKSITNAERDPTVPKPPPAMLIYEGPVKSFPPNICSDGWIQKTFVRQSGASKGSTDSYWFSPNSQVKLRSLKDVERFVAALNDCNGDEAAAFKLKGKY